MAQSLDGFIAGPSDEIAWVEQLRPSEVPFETGGWIAADTDSVSFDEFMAEIGCILMGRRTYDVVTSYEGRWPYGEVPMVVATSRALEAVRENVRGASGTIDDLIDQATGLAGDKDVYIDGGILVRQAIEADLLDHAIVTVMPTAIGEGISLFGGLLTHAEFAIERVGKWGPGLVQMALVPASRVG